MRSPGCNVLDVMKTMIKKGNRNMTKTVYIQAEFDAVVADPLGVASVVFAGASIDLIVGEVK